MPKTPHSSCGESSKSMSAESAGSAGSVRSAGSIRSADSIESAESANSAHSQCARDAALVRVAQGRHRDVEPIVAHPHTQRVSSHRPEGRDGHARARAEIQELSLIHISEPTRRTPISY